MKKRIILVGKAASGKDYLRRILLENGYSTAVSYTTRPPRPNEKEGVDYKFISEELAQEYINQDIFLEYVSFNGWIYGTTKEQWNCEKVFIMTPAGLSHVKGVDRNESFVIYLDIKGEDRLNRLFSRKMPGDSIERRMQADEVDFKNFQNYDMLIKSSDFNWQDIHKLLPPELK